MSSTREQLEKHNNLLRLKGVPTEELVEEPEPSAPSAEQTAKILRLRKLKNPKGGDDRFDDFLLEWNPNGTLDNLTFIKGKSPRFKWHFVWNIDGSLHRVLRR